MHPKNSLSCSSQTGSAHICVEGRPDVGGAYDCFHLKKKISTLLFYVFFSIVF